MASTDAWDEYMFHKERRLMAITDYSWRWEHLFLGLVSL
jgi:hypothetical protein